MKRELLRKYVWLVNTIRRHKRMTFEEIAGEWSRSSDNFEGTALALRTFHNHRESIETLFGIRIVCDRSDGNRYHISSDFGEGVTRLKIWMLTDLSMSHRVSGGTALGDRVIPDTDNMDAFYLSIIIESMKMDVMVELEYEGEQGTERHTVGAYALRYRRGRWLLAAVTADKSALKVFYLDRILGCTPTEIYFQYPADFSADAFFDRYFGIRMIGEEGHPRIITILARGSAREQLRKEALHATQKEIADLGGKSLFCYRFIPSEEFIEQMLSFGTEAEVIAPQHVRRELKRRVMEMSGMYAVKPDASLAYKAAQKSKT